MPQFRYLALNADKQPVAGEVAADSVAHAISQIEAAGLLVQSIGYATEDRPLLPALQPVSSDFPTLTTSEQAVLNSRLTEIVSRSRALTPALSAYAAELPPSPVRRRLQAFLRMLQPGDNSQSVAVLARQPAIWIPLLNAVTPESDRGQLLKTLLREFEPLNELSWRNRAWIVYPTVVISFAIAVFLFIGILVVPVFRDLFAGFGLRLPALTQFVLAFYASLSNGTFIIVAAVIFIVVLIVSRIAETSDPNESGNGSARPANRSAAVARFFRHVADLLDADFSAPTSLRLAGSAIARPRLKQAAVRVAAALEHGGDFFGVADRRTVTSSMLHALQSDSPKPARSATLRELSRCYEDRARTVFSWTGGMIEPIAILVIGFLVAMTVIALYLPLLTLLQALT